MSTTNTNRAKKRRLRRILTVLILCLLAAALVLWLLLRPREAAFTEETAKTGDISTYYSFSGNIETKERQSLLADKVMQIADILVEEGDRVQKGDVLLKTTMGEEITADIDGEVTAIYVEESATLIAGAQLIDLANYDDLQVTIRVDEYDLSTVSAGKEVTATINALGRDVSGTVSKVSREATTMNGVSYFTASVDLENDPDLRVGMSVEVRLLNQEAKGVTTLSVKAIQFDNENQPYVYIRDSDGKAVVQSVTVGINDGVTAQITEGVKPGDTVLIPKSDFMSSLLGE